MTWEQTAVAHGGAPAGEIWKRLTDPRAWPRWNDGVSWIAREGPLAPGSYVTVKPVRGRQTAFLLEAVVPEQLLLAVLTVGPAARLSIRWELAAQPGGGTAIRQTTAVSGPLGEMMRGRAQRIAHDAQRRLERLVSDA